MKTKKGRQPNGNPDEQANDHALSVKETIIDYLKTISAHEIPVIDCF